MNGARKKRGAEDGIQTLLSFQDISLKDSQIYIKNHPFGYKPVVRDEKEETEGKEEGEEEDKKHLTSGQVKSLPVVSVCS